MRTSTSIMDLEVPAPASNAGATRNITVRFTTRLPQAFRLPDQPYVLPANLNRRGLSTVVNQLLNLETPKAFDFLIGNEFLRTTLEEYVHQQEVAEAEKAQREEVIVLEYVEAVPPPEESQACQHDDWVSAVAARFPGFFLTGCYDNAVRVWSESDGACVATATGHSNLITDVAWISKAPTSDQSAYFASSSKDLTCRVWRVNLQVGSVSPLVTFAGHDGSVDALAVDPKRTKVVTASWDKQLRIWSVGDEAGATTDAKRRKVANESATTETTPLSVLSGHTNAVSAVCWPTATQIISASWDHSIRLWDSETQTATSTLSGAKVVTDLAYSTAQGLVATSHTDHAVRIWDPRSNEGQLVKKTYTSHKQWVSSVAWHPTASHLLVSGSYDNTFKLWDIRSSVALATVAAHTDKVLCVDVDEKDHIFSGSADCKLKLHKLPVSS